jgi:hypothetical protein
VQAASIAFDSPEAAAIDGLNELSVSIAETTGAMLTEAADGYGFSWITFSGAGLDDLAISISMVAESFDRAGCWEHLVCALFAFERTSGAPAYWIYNFERAGFYAFVPRENGGRGGRDNEEELRLHAAVAHDLRVEPDPQCRYPLWDPPCGSG